MSKPKSIRAALKTWVPRLLHAQRDNLNEADTVVRISKVFEEVLGYDPLDEIGRETQLKGKYLDLAIKIDGVIRILVEAKSAGTTLRDRHIEQAEGYASRNNYRWVLLTNGVMWNLYHLTFEQGIEYERAFSVNLAEDDLDTACNRLSLISRDSVRKQLHEKFWEHQSALSPSVLGKCIFQEDVLSRLRRAIRKENGILVDPEDLAAGIQAMLSTEARELIGPPRVIRKKKRGAPRQDSPSPKSRSKQSEQPQADLAVGTVLERAYKGKQHVVHVTADGFDYAGKKFSSLTAVAKSITGHKAISGNYFFGLTKAPGSTTSE